MINSQGIIYNSNLKVITPKPKEIIDQTVEQSLKMRKSYLERWVYYTDEKYR